MFVRTRMKTLDELTRFEKGGGGPSPAQQIAAAPVPLPAPPVTSTDPSVIQAEHDLAQQNLLKKSVKRTVLAGDTGGWNPAGNGPTARTMGGP